MVFAFKPFLPDSPLVCIRDSSTPFCATNWEIRSARFVASCSQNCSVPPLAGLTWPSIRTGRPGNSFSSWAASERTSSAAEALVNSALGSSVGFLALNSMAFLMSRAMLCRFTDTLPFSRIGPTCCTNLVPPEFAASSRLLILFASMTSVSLSFSLEDLTFSTSTARLACPCSSSCLQSKRAAFDSLTSLLSKPISASTSPAFLN
mmetsp:Transcript_70909/g.125299  ORF Transcript_70909/g.125299 Transcript_70909/m.125299 type:complete len:205 (+) Transcript_70909:60-674(+)